MRKSLNTKIYLILFTNSTNGEQILDAVGDIYDTLSYAFMEWEAEYKDISDKMLVGGWTCEKKEKMIKW